MIRRGVAAAVKNERYIDLLGKYRCNFNCVVVQSNFRILLQRRVAQLA